MKGNPVENAIVFGIAACLLLVGAVIIGYGTFHFADGGDPVNAGICAGVNWALAVVICVYHARKGK